MSARIVIPPTRDLCHALQMAALRRGWIIKCDGRFLFLIAKGVFAGVLIGEIALVALLYGGV